MKSIKKAFTIIEILVAITIVSIVLLIAFQSYTMILAGKVKLIERTNLQKEAFFFSERLFQLIKEGGTLDYEEYFNRKVVNEGFSDDDDLYEGGHYKQVTGFGNFGPKGKPGNGKQILGNGDPKLWHPYACRSLYGISYNPEEGCYKKIRGSIFAVNGDKYNVGASGTEISEIGVGPQKYGQYFYQFWDFNSNANDDNGLLGDEDGDGIIQGDDDDKDLGMGPVVFDKGANIHELYLLSGNKKTRTLFRWNFEEDTNALSGETCDSVSGGSGCLGTIQFLQLDARDWGYDNYKKGSGGPAENDGVIDTWVINKKFRSATCKEAGGYVAEEADQKYVAGETADMDGCWKDLFPPSLNVSKFEVRAYPNIDQNLAWKTDPAEIVSPYVVISLEIKPSWEIRRKIRGEIPALRFNTTVNLTDIFSK